MTHEPSPNAEATSPNPSEYADEADTLDWTVARDGRMAEYATPDDAVATEPA